MKFFVSWKLSAAEAAEASERPAAVRAEQAVRVVLDDRDVAVADRGLDAGHVAADARVVHGHDGAHRRRRRAASRGARDRGRASRARCRRTGAWRPRARTPSAVDVNVNDGTTTVSSGPRSSSIAAISSAAVHEVVSSTSGAPSQSREQLAAARGERPRARRVAGLDRGLDVRELVALERRLVESDHFVGHGSPTGRLDTAPRARHRDPRPSALDGAGRGARGRNLLWPDALRKSPRWRTSWCSRCRTAPDARPVRSKEGAGADRGPSGVASSVQRVRACPHVSVLGSRRLADPPGGRAPGGSSRSARCAGRPPR